MSAEDHEHEVRRDVQRDRPSVSVALSRAGVTDLRRIISIEDGGRAQLFYATIDLYADLSPEQTGVHMSRFSEVVEDLAEGLTRTPFPDVETLAERMASLVLTTQEALRSEVHVRAQSPIVKTTPVTGRPTQEIYTLVGIAAATGRGTRLLVGVEVDGLTACPCAQGMVREHAIERLLEDGYDEAESTRIVDLVPLASHNQRGRGTLLVGSERHPRAEELVAVVEDSMSSEIYELLKRPDELHVVEKAHRNPRFVEDVVREMVRRVVEQYPDLPDDAFVLARQENFEGIHEHNAFAERYGTLAEIRSELTGEAFALRHTALDEWLVA
ncbi:MAG TPA: GTP cyclohydrolase MptA [Thermoleophilia bacterium]|nr:GTP cyclohydrolase MptA [Thermoleophilia bacterium]HQG03559.1 GTP cyclohydrolase MptA [Thermoleophilia bacterium]HQG53959.1 GTP cyclohydrolase MptA [Thermoleophilia bacterium]HQJ97143.1 GTP cyclohydrolase MptA [Thermoleophilia bacterium]